jgi:hypothetical protein
MHKQPVYAADRFMGFSCDQQDLAGRVDFIRRSKRITNDVRLPPTMMPFTLPGTLLIRGISGGFKSGRGDVMVDTAVKN